jgi:hypothetical protein
MHGAQRHESKIYGQRSELHVRLYSGYQIIEVNILARGRGGSDFHIPLRISFFVFLYFFVVGSGLESLITIALRYREKAAGKYNC